MGIHNLIPVETHPAFKDGDGGGDTPKYVSFTISVVDNGYVLTAMCEDPELDFEEIFFNNDDLIKRLSGALRS